MVSLFDALGLGAFRAFASQDLCLHNLVKTWFRMDKVLVNWATLQRRLGVLRGVTAFYSVSKNGLCIQIIYDICLEHEHSVGINSETNDRIIIDKILFHMFFQIENNMLICLYLSVGADLVFSSHMYHRDSDSCAWFVCYQLVLESLVDWSKYWGTDTGTYMYNGLTSKREYYFFSCLFFFWYCITWIALFKIYHCFWFNKGLKCQMCFM